MKAKVRTLRFGYSWQIRQPLAKAPIRFLKQRTLNHHFAWIPRGLLELAGRRH